MSSQSLYQPLEGLLRPPLEWFSAITAFGLLFSLNGFSIFLLLPEALKELSYMGLLFFAGWRFWQGYQIWCYHRHLKHAPDYIISSKNLLIKTDQIFLGKGFLWEPIHTQRLRDLDLPYNQIYTVPSKEQALIGGHPHLHGVSLKEKDIFINLLDRGSHVVVIGLTGVGKTRFAELLVSQDIRRGDAVIFLDPKGDQALLNRMKAEAKLAGREDSVRVFHLGFPQESCRYNPIGFFTKITQVATRITNALPSTGEAAAFKEFAWKYVNLVTRGLMALNLTPNYKRINFYLTKLDLLFMEVMQALFKEDLALKAAYEDYSCTHQNTKKPLSELALMLTFAEEYMKAKGYEKIKQDVQLQFMNDLMTACRLDRSYYDKITASVGPLLEKLTTGEIADLLSPDESNPDQRPTIDWLSVIREKQIVYVGMDALTDSIISSVVGNAMLSDMVATAGHLYKFGLEGQTSLPRINLHADEFNEIIGDEFIPILNKARGAGFNVVAYTQTWSDVEARVNSTAKAGQVAGNLGTVIMFRCKEAKTVDMLIKQLPKVPILRSTPASSSHDTAHGQEGVYFQSSNEDRLSYQEVPMIDQNDVINLPKGQAFALLEGGKLYKLRMLLSKD